MNDFPDWVMNINDDFSKTVNRFKLDFGETGYAKVDNSWNLVDMCSPYSRLYFIDSGKGEVISEDGTTPLLPGHVYLIPALHICTLRCDEKLGHLFFHINLIGPDKFDIFAEKPVCSLNIGSEEVLHLKKLYLDDTFISRITLKNEAEKYVISFMDMLGINKLTQHEYSPCVTGAIRYITKNLSVNITASDVASAVLVSPSKLAKQFRSETGTTVGKYIDSLVFFRAEYLLTCTNMSLKEISTRLGFCDQFYFSRRFSQKHGEPPFVYRKRLRIS